MSSCVCSCKAYGGNCACRFDGRSAGRLEGIDLGREDTVKRIYAWLRRTAEGHRETVKMYPREIDRLKRADDLDDLATEIEDNEWR